MTTKVISPFIGDIYDNPTTEPDTLSMTPEQVAALEARKPIIKLKIEQRIERQREAKAIRITRGSVRTFDR